MIRTMARACRMTRQRINCCERLALPPFIILARPSRRTTATAPKARNEIIWKNVFMRRLTVQGSGWVTQWLAFFAAQLSSTYDPLSKVANATQAT